jgi:methylenetetrahydrofolate reductase (NADPH)
MAAQSRQLDMSFDGDQRLAESFRQGQFVTLLELNTPAANQAIDSAAALLQPLLKQAAALPEISGFTLNDRPLHEARHDQADFAQRLLRDFDKSAVLTFSGTDSDLDRVKAVCAAAHGLGLRNVLCVTGDLPASAPTTPAAATAAAKPRAHLDSAEALRALASFNRQLCLGAAVNPYRYTAEDQCLQYAKMLRKLRSGARFLIAQAGWDMKKSQELQWFMQMRELHEPILARVIVFSQEEALRLGEWQQPGITLPVPLAAQIMREANCQPSDFLAAQARRCALQIIGYRVLGYSGVQLVGCRDPKLLSQLINQCREWTASCEDYPSWLEQWHKLHGAISFAPAPSEHHSGAPHYLFRNLLSPEQRDYVLDDRFLGQFLDKPDLGDQWRFRMAKGHQGAASCFGLPYRSACPKQLRYGPCGGSQSDGLCETGQHPCFFQRVLRLLAHNNAIQLLEEALPEHD